ncbi:fungal specific transcription factor [Trichoderma arundinaceum]|uniref:Fungal specific transcription factor n=1 Tax=Trichoderma arundinaceum TaxID=490622 RepID=A0A395P1G4_TRIAR|nr:fungal specific transcription factor [Trichoderma arundinaceum]
MQGQACIYRTARNSEPKVDDDAPLPSLATSKLDLVPDREGKAMAAVRFLDPELFQRSLKGTPLTLLTANRVPRYVQNLVMGRETPLRIATEYYQLVHPWLPIISKRKVYERLLSPLVPIRVDVAFLLLCMSLLASSYKEIEDPDGSLEYRAAVQYFTEIQRSGIVTPEVLQGCILLAIYEWGHAIYPAAEISIGTSLRYALSLGMGWNKTTQGALDSTWADEEEERRTWWAIYVIERLV